VDVTYQRLTRRQRADLAGYVSPFIAAFRMLLFAVAVCIVGLVLRAVHRLIVDDPVPAASEAWWAIPTLAFAVALYQRAGRWTGRRELRDRIRADLARGEVAIRRINAVDAIEIGEQGDSGPAFFVLTAEGTTMLFTGQHLAPLKRKGFPWTAFDIVETPASRIFFRISPAGDRLPPSATRPPFTQAEMKAYAATDRAYDRVVDVDFASLLRSASS
jgi:hypothetical protein